MKIQLFSLPGSIIILNFLGWVGVFFGDRLSADPKILYSIAFVLSCPFAALIDPLSGHGVDVGTTIAILILNSLLVGFGSSGVVRIAHQR